MLTFTVSRTLNYNNSRKEKEMSGPIFKVGDEVAWANKPPNDVYESGPFIIVETLRNNPNRHYAGTLPCPKLGDKSKDHVPSQWVTVCEKKNGRDLIWEITLGDLLKGHKPKSIKWDSRWFRKAS